MDYIVTGQPRSRTAWLACLLTYGSSFCSHELLTTAGFEGASAALSRLNYKFRGVSDSSAGWCWKRILKKFPQIKVLRVRRPWQEAATSHHRYFSANPLPGVETPSLPMTELLCMHLDRELDKMENTLPKEQCRVVDFTDLNNELTCKWAWEFLLPGEAWNSERFGILDKMRINLASEKY